MFHLLPATYIALTEQFKTRRTQKEISGLTSERHRVSKEKTSPGTVCSYDCSWSNPEYSLTKGVKWFRHRLFWFICALSGPGRLEDGCFTLHLNLVLLSNENGPKMQMALGSVALSWSMARNTFKSRPRRPRWHKLPAQWLCQMPGFCGQWPGLPLSDLHLEARERVAAVSLPSFKCQVLWAFLQLSLWLSWKSLLQDTKNGNGDC